MKIVRDLGELSEESRGYADEYELKVKDIWPHFLNFQKAFKASGGILKLDPERSKGQLIAKQIASCIIICLELIEHQVVKLPFSVEGLEAKEATYLQEVDGLFIRREPLIMYRLWAIGFAELMKIYHCRCAGVPYQI